MRLFRVVTAGTRQQTGLELTGGQRLSLPGAMLADALGVSGSWQDVTIQGI